MPKFAYFLQASRLNFWGLLRIFGSVREQWQALFGVKTLVPEVLIPDSAQKVCELLAPSLARLLPPCAGQSLCVSGLSRHGS